MKNKKNKVYKNFWKLMKSNRGEFAVGSVVAIAATLIVGGLIFIPGLRDLGHDVIDAVTGWWNSLQASIFTA